MIPTLLLLTSLSLPSCQQPGTPGIGVPHPSFPIPGADDSASEASVWHGEPWWVALAPSWKDRYALLEDSLRETLLDRVAGAQGAELGRTSAWLAATRPQTLMVNYRILVDGAETLVGRESVRMGQAVAFADLVRHAEILDFDVEIASGAGIFDPVMGFQFSGSSLALQVLPIPGVGWSAEIALVHSRRLPSEPIAMKYAQVDGKDRLIGQIAEVGCRTLLLPGQTLNLDLPQLGPGQLSLEILADSPAPPDMVTLEDQLVWLSLPTLAQSSTSWNHHFRLWEQKHALWSNGQGDLVFEGEEAVDAAKAAILAARAELQNLHINLSVQPIVGGVEGQRSDLQAEVLAGTALQFAQGTVRDVLTEWDVEVAQVARIADPAFSNLFSGWQGNLSAHPLADGRYQVDMDLSFSTVEVGEPRMIRLAGATAGQQGYEGNVPASPAHTMVVETPQVREVRFRGSYVTDGNGRLILIRSANSVLGEGGRLRIELRLSGA